MTTEIIDLELGELSFVDDPANQKCWMTLFKSAGWKHPAGKGLIDGDHSTIIPDDETRKGNTMSEADLKKQFDADIAKANGETEAATNRADAAEKRAEAMAKALEAAGFKVDGEAVEKRAPEDFIEIEGERVLKSSVPAYAIKQAERVAKLEQDAEKVAMEKRVETEIPDLSGTVAEKSALLGAIDAIKDEDQRNGAAKALAAANKAAIFLKTASGRRADDPDIGDDKSAAAKKLDEMAEDHAAKAGITKAAAYEAVKKTAEGRKLLSKSLN